ncbi:MAG: hypothetical protein AB7S72_02245 [Draconibacterium sp.]
MKGNIFITAWSTTCGEKGNNEPLPEGQDKLNERYVLHDFITKCLEPGMVRLQFRNQKAHHKDVSFEEEYRQVLIENSIDIDVCDIF